MKESFKIFVVFHKELILEFYPESILPFLIFVNVSSKNYDYGDKYKIIRLDNFKDFYPLGKWYAESEVVYNVFKNKYMYEDDSFIGFVHYDMDLRPLENFVNNNLMTVNETQLLLLQPYTLREDIRQSFLMDVEQPDKWIGRGKKCYNTIFEEFNCNYKTDYSVNQFRNSTVGLCCAFIVETTTFDKLMIYISQVIESRKLDLFDKNHKYRMQGGLLERYIAVWFLLNNVPFDSLKLYHNFVTTASLNKRQRVIHKVKSTIKRIFK